MFRIISPLRVLSVTVFLLVAACAGPPSNVKVPAAGQATVGPEPEYSYEHTMADTEALRRELVVAVGRVDDTKDPGTPFGAPDSSSGAIVVQAQDSQVSVTSDAASTDPTQATLTPQDRPAGMGVAARSQLVAELHKANVFTVLEREDIISIVRELEFAGSKWVNSDDAANQGELKGVRYIVTGSIEMNPKFSPGPATPDNWTETKQPVLYRLRMYSVETGEILAVATAVGANRHEAMARAVRQLAGRASRAVTARGSGE